MDCLGNTSEVEYRLLETFYSSGAEILVSPPMCPVREKDKISIHPKHMENDSLSINIYVMPSGTTLKKSR